MCSGAHALYTHRCACRYVQLSGLRPEQLKGTIRIEFVNETGLAEAGIDRTGVFKEFLEDTIARAFDPNRGLFVQTPKQQLCPSPTSELADPHHLRLFEFVGRMLGKSLYEGITLEVPLADFFIAKLLGKHSSLDELPSLDETLYSSLDFVKRCPAPRATGQMASPVPSATSTLPLRRSSPAARSHAPACGARAAAMMATSRRTCA